MTRRENDKKVLAVKIQMKDLMTAFFEFVSHSCLCIPILNVCFCRLRHIHHSEEKGPDGVTVSQRLEGLIHTIANDIKMCGSVCDTYLKKGFLGEFRGHQSFLLPPFICLHSQNCEV